MSLEVFGDGGDGGDVEDLSDVASRYGYEMSAVDGKWREVIDEPGFTDDEMWEYIEARRASDEEDMLMMATDDPYYDAGAPDVDD